MKKSAFILVFVGLLATTSISAQVPANKSVGEVFFNETFDWGNPDDPKGWTAPEGYFFLDPLDLGFNWVWWPPDLGFKNQWTDDPPLNSTTRENGYLALFLEQYNQEMAVWQDLDNSVVFPIIDCSEHSSVIVRFETQFLIHYTIKMFLEITTDGWTHFSSYDVSFGSIDKGRPLDNSPGVPAIYEMNITEIAAGQPNVQMRLHWSDTDCYFWVIDDFSLLEGYRNDMKLNYIQLEWDDNNPITEMAWIHNIPKSQLDGGNGFFNFKSGVMNFGELTQYDVFLDLNITKNGNSVFHEKSYTVEIPVGATDTLIIQNKYSPIDYGHYKVEFEVDALDTDDNPENNRQEIFFNVTDSIYSRSDNSNEFSWSFEGRYYNPEGTEDVEHFIGSIFPIFNDCEVNSISAFITGGKADDYINYQFKLYLVTYEDLEKTPYELITSDVVQLDSSDFNTWVTLPLHKDGESEFLKKGDLIYAGIQYDNLNPDIMVRRNMGLEIGTDKSVQLTENSAIARYKGYWNAGQEDGYVGNRNLMIRLNLNDHNNIVDHVQFTPIIAALGQNFPNPFSQRTEIPYELNTVSEVSFEVKDLSGRTILQVNKGMTSPGKYTFILEKDNLDSGFYFLTLVAGSYIQTRQIVIVD